MCEDLKRTAYKRDDDSSSGDSNSETGSCWRQYLKQNTTGTGTILYALFCVVTVFFFFFVGCKMAIGDTQLHIRNKNPLPIQVSGKTFVGYLIEIALEKGEN